MTSRRRARLRSRAWLLLFTCIGLVQAGSQLRPFFNVLYVPKWLSTLLVVASFVVLARGRLTTRLALPFGAAVGVIALGLVAQIGDGLDARAGALATTLLLTATTSLVIAPHALARGWVRRGVWSGLLMGVTLVVVFGFAGGVFTLPAGLALRDGHVRYFGLFAHPNTGGTIFLTGVVLAGACAVARRRWTPLLAIIPMGIALALAYARGAAIAAAAFVSLLSFFWIWDHWPRVRVVLAVTVLAVCAIGGSRLLERGLPSRGDLNEITSGRLETWGRSLAYLESPVDWLVGVGLSRNHSFVSYTTSPMIATGRVGIRGTGTDSVYVDLITRTGLVGLVLFLGMVAFVAKQAWRGWREMAGAEDEAAVALAGLSAAMVHMLTDSTTFSLGLVLALVVWPLAGGAAVRVALFSRHSALNQA